MQERRERDKRNIKIDKASVTGNTKRTKFKEHKRNQIRGRSRVREGEKQEEIEKKVRRMKKRNCT